MIFSNEELKTLNLVGNIIQVTSKENLYNTISDNFISRDIVNLYTIDYDTDILNVFFNDTVLIIDLISLNMELRNI